MMLTVGSADRLLCAAEMKISMSRIADWPAAIFRLKVLYGLGFRRVFDHINLYPDPLRIRAYLTDIGLNLCSATCALVRRKRT